MKKKLTTVAFNGTKEQEVMLDAVIAEHKGRCSVKYSVNPAAYQA